MSGSGHGSVTPGALRRAVPLLLLVLGVGAAASEAPWYAPWRAIDVRTEADAEAAWALVREFFGNLREGHAHEVWEVDAAAAPPARPMADCVAALAEAGRAWGEEPGRYRVSAQVRVVGEVEGVAFVEGRRGTAEEGVVMGCELALRLPRVARILRDHGVVRAEIGSPVRFTLRSYHRFGLALDVYRLGLEDGRELVVEDVWELRPDEPTCGGERSADGDAALLRDLACALFADRVLSTVITPEYNAGHRNHFHWDVRPGDERFYLR